MNQIRMIDLESLKDFPNDILYKLRDECEKIETLMTEKVVSVFELIAEGKLPLTNLSDAKKLLIMLKDLSQQEWFIEYGVSNLFDSYSVEQIIKGISGAIIIHSRLELVFLVEQMFNSILAIFKETISFLVDQDEIKLLRNHIDTLKQESNPIMGLIEIVYLMDSMAKWMFDTSKRIQKTKEIEEIMKTFGIYAEFLCEEIHGYCTHENINFIEYEKYQTSLLEKVQELMLSDTDNLSAIHRIYQVIDGSVMTDDTISISNLMTLKLNNNSKLRDKMHKDLTEEKNYLLPF